MFPPLTFIAPSALGASTFVGADIRTSIRVQSLVPSVHNAVRKTNSLNVSMTALSSKPTTTSGGSDNPDNIDYKTYDYVGAWGFNPLSNTNWFAAGSSSPGGITDWTATMNVNFDRIDRPDISVQHPVQVQVTSYNNNSYRVRFNPDGPIRDVSRGPILKQQLDWIRTQEKSQGCDPKIKFTDEGFLTFETKDLNVIIYGNFKTRVTRKSDNMVIMENDEVPAGGSGNKCRGLMFVDRLYGNAIASVNKNFHTDTTRNEAFYGAGEINCKYNDTYVLERSGLAMTNFNYDNLNYNQPDLKPPGWGDKDFPPDYFIPMYYAAPWLVVHGRAGKSDQYSYGWFMDNVSQTYMNTGDERWDSGQQDLAYMGAQYGPFDQHFVLGPGDGVEGVVRAFSLLQGKEFENQVLNKRAVMPPKYVFGLFQGVFGTTSLLRQYMPAGENNISVQDIVEGYQDNKFPFEGLAVDVDMQDDLRVFTTKGEFWSQNTVGSGGDPNNRSVFEWAHDKGLVCQTNITCFLRNNNSGKDYEVNRTLREKGLYTKNDSLTNTDFGMTNDGPNDAYIGHLDYGGGVECDAIFPDWGRPDVAEWWGDNYKKLFKIGLDFVWQDMTVPAMMPHKIGDPVDQAPGGWPNDNDPSNGRYNWKTYHPQVLVTDMRYENHGREPMVTQRNLHAYTLCESTRKEGIVNNADTLTKFRRSFIISRGGYIGNQHFGGMWVGDNSTTSHYLQMMIANIINMNMSCMPLVGSDIGGFTSYVPSPNDRTPCTADLMVRYVQAGFLLPWFRNHYDRWIESKQHGKDYQEFYMYKDDMNTLRSFVELRYRWQEVLYTAMYQNVESGKPIIKSVTMYNNDQNVKSVQDDEFLLGGRDGYSILCAPIVWENSDRRNVYLPVLSKWYRFGPDFDTKALESPLEGGQTMDYWAPREATPMFVREGSILPTRYTLDGQNKSINTYTDDDPLVFEVFPLDGNNSGAGMCYLDDGGVTTDAEDNGAYSVLNVDATQNGGTKTITLTNDRYGYVFGGSFYVRVRGEKSPSSVKVSSGAGSGNVTASSVSDRCALFNSSDDGQYWVDGATDSVWIKLPNTVLQDAVITIS